MVRVPFTCSVAVPLPSAFPRSSVPEFSAGSVELRVTSPGAGMQVVSELLGRRAGPVVGVQSAVVVQSPVPPVQTMVQLADALLTDTP